MLTRTSRTRGRVTTLLHLATLAAGVGHSADAQETVPGPAQDRTLRWQLERRWSVGGADDETLQLATLFAKDIATDAQGRLHVIDRNESRVVVYDAKGALVRTFGGRGMGPGELSAPVVLDVDANGTVHAYDVEKEAVVRFAADGRVLPEYRPARRFRGFRLLPNGAMVGLSVRGDTMRLVQTRGDSLQLLLAHALPPTRSTPPVCRLTNYPAPPVFAASLAWAARGERVVAATDGFRLTLFEHGVARRVLTRDAVRRRTSSALARQHLGAGQTMQLLGMRPCVIPAELILSVAEVAKELPAYSGVTIAPDGRIWALRYAVRGETHHVDVFDPVRGYEGTVAVGAAVPIAFLSSGELVSLEHDADDVPLVVVYAVKR